MKAEEIKRAVCRYFDISENQVESPLRKREIVQVRQIGMYLIKKHTKLSLSAIGREYGHRDHTTVIHAMKTVNDLMDTDKVYLKQLKAVERAILNKQYLYLHCNELIGFDLTEQNNKHLPI